MTPFILLCSIASQFIYYLIMISFVPTDCTTGSQQISSTEDLWESVQQWSNCTSSSTCKFPLTKQLPNGSTLLLLKVPFPSGIEIENRPFINREDGSSGGSQRICKVHHSAVSVRPSWASVYTIPLFTATESLDFVTMTEKYGSSVGGWGRSHNKEDQLPSVDLPALKVMGSKNYTELTKYLESSILKAMAHSFNLDASLLRLRFDLWSIVL